MGDILVNVLEFVLLMDEKYGIDWVVSDLTEEERTAYDYFRWEWNQTFGNCGPVEFQQIEEDD